MTAVKFAAFFAAVHGHEPFPWQARLAGQVLETGWPKLLDLPTGTGKTSTLDVALWALAMAPEKMPRRILLVVDRRIVVDQGATLARKLLAKLRSDNDAAIVEVAKRLRALWGGADHEAPFAVAVMRGGMPKDNDWARRPDQPVIGVSTIDQVGSRLLFRGYGISAWSASIYAGLLGNDTLILLDEVHLAKAFAETLQAIGKHYRKARVALPERFSVVQMSATPGGEAPSEPAFVLDGKDRAHPLLKQRLGAHKPARLEVVEVRGDNEAGKRAAMAERAVKEALRLQSEGAKVIALVVNRVDTARLAWGLLEKHEHVTKRLLVTGRMRPIDRDDLVRTKLLPGAGGERVCGEGDPALVVVATQCIEAGADLDFDGLVTECASLDALRQRFGRLDRRGAVTAKRGEAPAVILCRSDLAAERATDPVYGEALAATWRWLQGQGKVVGFGIDELAKRMPEGEELSPMLAPALSAPVLLPAHLDSWAHTSPCLRPSPEPDPALWLHGPQRASSEVQVIWRADLGELPEASREAGEALEELLVQVRPSSLEAMSLPIHVARAWLGESEEARGMADVLAEQEPKEEGGRRQKEKPRGKRYLLLDRDEPLRWRRLGEKVPVAADGDDEEKLEDLRPGDLVLVPSSYGGINSDGTFDPEAQELVPDLGDVAQLRGRGKPTLRMSPAALACWKLPAEALEKKVLPAPAEDELAKDAKEKISDWVKKFWPHPDAAPEGFIGTAVEWRVMRKKLTKLRYQPKEIAGEHWLVMEPRDPKSLREDELTEEVGDAVSEDDDSSFRAAAISLRQHSGDVQRWAKAFAARLGFSAALVEDVALAGWLHDVGKADARFQRWLAGGDEVRASIVAEPMAKSALAGNRIKREQARRRAGYPRGYRHELLSLAMIERNEQALAKAHDRELVLHLVASHHGWCRPFAPLLDDERELETTLQHGEHLLTASTRHRAARMDSGISRRFWGLVTKYGWWGLAWLEAVMRLGDHRASEEETEKVLEAAREEVAS